MILNKYIRHKTSYDLQFGDDDISGHSRYYKILHEAYTQIAILDEKIDYTIMIIYYLLNLRTCSKVRL